MTGKNTETPMYLVPGRLTKAQISIANGSLYNPGTLAPMEAVIDAIGIPIQPCADVETVYRLPVLEADEIRPGVSSLVFRQGAELVRRTDMDVQIAARDAEITRLRVVEAEMHLLEEVCAFYANDEDRFIKSDGNAEPYGMIPTDVGMKARSARARFMAREQAAQNTGGQA